jgi:hypothetical protein
MSTSTKSYLMVHSAINFLAALQWLQVLRENIFTSGWDLSSEGGLFSDSDIRISFPGAQPHGGGALMMSDALPTA